MARVVIEHLVKEFKGAKNTRLRAVDDLGLIVEENELLVVVGPSGCGKTTTLRLIAGLEAPTSGSISLDGQSMHGVLPKERDVAMVFQNHALYPHMTAWENMAFGLQLRKFQKPEIARRVGEAAEILGLSGCLDRRPEALSGGERQRVALGRAIVRKPRLFLFDEPLSNLDAPLRTEMRTELARLHRQFQWTMIYVTHDQGEGMMLGHRMAVMNQGQIQQIAEPLTVYRSPANLFTAGFIGSPSMNLIEGTLARGDNGYCFQKEKTRLELPIGSSEPFAAYAGKEVLLGFRPENVLIREQTRENDLAFPATVEIVETLGAESHVHLQWNGSRVISRVAGSAQWAPGQNVLVRFNFDPLLLFDPGTGRRIT